MFCSSGVVCESSENASRRRQKMLGHGTLVVWSTMTCLASFCDNADAGENTSGLSMDMFSSGASLTWLWEADMPFSVCADDSDSSWNDGDLSLLLCQKLGLVHLTGQIYFSNLQLRLLAEHRWHLPGVDSTHLLLRALQRPHLNYAVSQSFSL